MYPIIPNRLLFVISLHMTRTAFLASLALWAPVLAAQLDICNPLHGDPNICRLSHSMGARICSMRSLRFPGNPHDPQGVNVGGYCSEWRLAPHANADRPLFRKTLAEFRALERHRPPSILTCHITDRPQIWRALPLGSSRWRCICRTAAAWQCDSSCPRNRDFVTPLASTPAACRATGWTMDRAG